MEHIRNMSRSGAIALSIILLSVVYGCGTREWRTAEGVAWGTTYHITYCSDRDLHDSIVAVMRKVELSMSPFERQSVVSKLNHGESDEVDSIFICVFNAARQVWLISDGAFDPTVAPAVNLWGFGYKSGMDVIDSLAIDSVRAMVGLEKCSLNGIMIVKDTGVEFDFSAITKGYGCDAVAAMLLRNGCGDYMVEIGGEITLGGENRRGEPWHIMIDSPVENDSAVVHDGLMVVKISDCGIATSGNYRNYKRIGDVKVWHTIDPRTCRPAPRRSLSATVIAENALMADALATACMVMEPDSALDMIESIDRAEVLLVLPGDDGVEYKIVKSSSFPGCNVTLP